MDAAELAIRALRHRDRSRREVDERLERAGIPEDERARALDGLVADGLLSDGRFAEERSRVLAGRGASDEQIRRELRRHGIDDETVVLALARLDPEPERAARIFDRRGRDSRALRYLAGRGFGPDSLEQLAEAARGQD
jgi:regulatory protein